MNKAKKAAAKKQTGKAAKTVTPVTPDLDKAETLINKMIADGTFQKMADDQAKIHQERINALRERDKIDKLEKEQKGNNEKLLAETAQEQALSVMKEYLALANTSPRYASNLPLHILSFLDYNIPDNLHSYYIDVPLQVLTAMTLPAVAEPLKKSIGESNFQKFADILQKLVNLVHAISYDNANVAELEVCDYDFNDKSEQRQEQLLIKKSEYEHKLQALKEEIGIWKAYDEARKD